MDIRHDIAAIAAGSIKAFEKLYVAYYNKVLTYTSILLQDSAKAEDVTQNVFLKLWRNRDRLKEDGQLDSYIYITARRAVLDVFREEGYAVKYQEWAKSKQMEESPDAYCLKEIELIAASVIDGMPPRRKEIFIMSRVEGLQAKEIAEKLGLSVHTVNKHIALALSMLKEKMGDFLPIAFALLYFDRIW